MYMKTPPYMLCPAPLCFAKEAIQAKEIFTTVVENSIVWYKFLQKKKKEKRVSHNRGRVNENCVPAYVDTKTDVYVHVFNVCRVPASVAPFMFES